MRLDTALGALRGDPASQRAAQLVVEAAKGRWRSSAVISGMAHDLADFAQGSALPECARLAAVFTNPVVAGRIVRDLVTELVPAMAAEPLGQVPFRHQYSRGMAVQQLLVSGGAAISLVLYEHHASGSDARSICFTDSERHEIALAGTAALQIVRRGPMQAGRADLTFEPITLAAGDMLTLCGNSETKLVTTIRQRLLVLRLARTPANPQPSLEFRVSDGTLVHRAAGDRADSRHEMMAALLGQMRRTEAAPVLAQMTRSGSDHLRWEALRQCLALDSGAGFAALGVIARDSADPLSGTASALRAQLIEAHPQLAALEEYPCPAS